jgi:YD repeat-containing protein
VSQAATSGFFPFQEGIRLVGIPTVMSDLVVNLVPQYHTFHPGVDRLYCMNYMHSGGELAVTRFTYTRNRNDFAFYQDITGGRSSKNVHQFDKQGRIIRKERTYNDGETSIETFDYDDQERLLRETFENSGGVKGLTKYVYGKDGNASLMICDNYKGWLTGELRFTFDNSGRRREGTILTDGAPAGTISFEYESSGNLLKEHWEFASGWSQTFHFVYEGC